VKPEKSCMRRKLRPQKQWDGTQGLSRVWHQHRNIEKKWIDFRENWQKPAWITHSTKSSARSASAGEVHNRKEENKKARSPKSGTGPVVVSKGRCAKQLGSIRSAGRRPPGFRTLSQLCRAAHRSAGRQSRRNTSFFPGIHRVLARGNCHSGNHHCGFGCLKYPPLFVAESRVRPGR
jgi:hypothetical protein